MLNDDQSSENNLPGYSRKFLKEPPDLLRGFHYEDVQAFMTLGIEERFVAGDIVTRENEAIKCAYLVGKGDISIWKNSIELSHMSEGDFLGETFLFNKFYKPGKILAEADTILLKYDRFDVLNYFRKKPEKLFNIFTKNIIDLQNNKINSLNMQLIKLKQRLLDTDKW